MEAQKRSHHEKPVQSRNIVDFDLCIMCILVILEVQETNCLEFMQLMKVKAEGTKKFFDMDRESM